MSDAWAHETRNGYVVVTESSICPGHATTHPNGFRNMTAVNAYCRKNALTLQEGRCTMPRIVPMRPIRDDAP